MPAYLDSILVAHRTAAAADDRDVAQVTEAALESLAVQRSSTGISGPRDFVAALQAGHAARGMAVVSEIKRRSPSKGDLDLSLDPASVACNYEAGGASCLSVLTDRQFFGGSRADLEMARSSCALPVLRKDFTVSPLDVCDARLMGADAVLLIVAALDDVELDGLLVLAHRLALAPLMEVHDEVELDRALAVDARLIGVNQRDLRTFEVDRDRAMRMGERMPEGVVSVADSGIRDAADVERLAAAGYTAVLVGETLVRSNDRSSAVDGLLGARA
jgi:indole-3-glycerol phosphate synthase